MKRPKNLMIISHPMTEAYLDVQLSYLYPWRVDVPSRLQADGVVWPEILQWRSRLVSGGSDGCREKSGCKERLIGSDARVGRGGGREM